LELLPAGDGEWDRSPENHDVLMLCGAKDSVRAVWLGAHAAP